MSALAFKVADRDLPLRLTMRRAELLEELTGVDVLNDPSGMGKPQHIIAAVYALAGGEDGVGMAFDAFKDEITPGMVREASQLVVSVFLRDAGGGEAGAEGKAPAAASPSKG